jgi:NAD(P)-dependent dehydrogenase (short-subunit alcohol dehydrogenase family)
LGVEETTMTTSNQTSIALITGGSRGLGKSMALQLAARGVDSIITYRTQATEAAAVVAAITALGRRAVALQLDVGESATFAEFTDRVRATLAREWQRKDFDYLVNNAGMGTHAPFLETSETQFDALVNVHLKGPFFLSQKLVPLLADGGRIVNVSSGLARFSFPGYAAYAAMKGGVEVLTRYMAKELGARRISVNTLAPGAIATDFGGGQVRDNAELNRNLASQTALGRVGLPDDIGGAVAMLLAPENHWITGQRIEASGGMML